MSGSSPWLQATDGRLILKIHAQPGAKRSAFAGAHGEALKVRIAAPAVDGKANAELLRFIAESLGLPRQAVTILSGETGRAKRLAIQGITAAAVIATASGVRQ